jgi:hypothetical protein
MLRATSCGPNFPIRRLVEPELKAEVINANDDKSPLIDLLTCIICKVTMKIASSTPESSGTEIIQYRCEQCGRIELVRLIRGSRDEPT